MAPCLRCQYDLQKDFQPVSLVSSDPLIIVAKKSIPANDLKEFAAWLRANPEATQGTTGAGGVGTVAGLLFQKETGTRFRFVPYRGGQGPAMQAVVASQIDFMIATAANSLPHVGAGTIQGLRRYVEEPARRGARYPDSRRSGTTGAPRLELASNLSAQSNPHERSRQTECGCGRRLGRSGGAPAACRARAGDFSARSANAGSAASLSRRRDREVVADHPGRQHQGRVTSWTPPTLAGCAHCTGRHENTPEHASPRSSP